MQPVKYLIVDTNALIKGVNLANIGVEVWTVPEVLSEVRDARTRHVVSTLPFELKTREPSEKAIAAVVAFSRKIGESALSKADLKVLALTYMFDSEINGGNDIKETPQQVVEADPEATAEEEREEEGSGSSDENEDEEQDNADDGGEWITPDNLEEMKTKHATDVSAEPVNVGCITTDFAMQNVLMQMGLKVISHGGLKITKARQFIRRCFSCYKFCKQPDKVFCPVCGNNTLIKVSYEVDSEGKVSYSQVQRIRTRGTKYSIPLPKGGRKNNDIVLAEDHFYERQRVAPRKKAGASEDGFLFGAAQSGPTSKVEVGYGRKNPNVARHKIGKKNRSICNQ